MSIPTENDQASSADNLPASIPLILRKAVRYGGVEMKASLYRKGFFHLATPFDVEILDISTRGACIASKRKLAIDAAYGLTIVFNSGKTFDIPGKVLHKKTPSEDAYGFKFDAYNNELGDYLLDSQEDLTFK